MAKVPSSEGSLHEEEEEGRHGGGLPSGERGEGRRTQPEKEQSDGFDSDEFREYLRYRKEIGSRPRSRASKDRDSDDEKQNGSKGGATQPPELDGTGSFQDWLIKARLWLATCRARPQSQGPMILQRLSGAPFQAFKHWAKDTSWLSSRDGGQQLLNAMDQPEYFGEDKEEDMISSLAKLTYHMKRNRDEKHREFFNRWEEALRKTKEHGIDLPDRYLGFLMINALGLDEPTIKNLLSYMRGSIATRDVKEWTRKFETKLLAKDMGVESKKVATGSGMQKGSNTIYNLTNDHADYMGDEDDEIHQVEVALEELQEPEQGEPGEEDATSELVLDEHEAAEVLNTMLQQRRKTFSQSWKLKKAKEVARGYSDWKGKGNSGKGKGKNKGMSVEELKAMTRCKNCGKVGHWHRECPEPKKERPTRELNYVEEYDSPEVSFCGLLEKIETETFNEPEKTNELEVPAKNDKMNENDYEVDKSNRQEENTEEKQAFCLDEIHEPANEIEQENLMVEPKAFCLTSSTEMSVSRKHLRDEVQAASGSQLFEAVETQQSLPDQEIARSYKERPEWNVGTLNQEEHEVLWQEEQAQRRTWRDPMPRINEDCCATIDTGCQRMAIGQTTLDLLAQAITKEVSIGKIPQTHKFKSVHGKSETTHVATVPTSLGHRGAILRPATFANVESTHAPFLISLPFLLFCRSVLHLDPQDGLRIYFRKFKFSVRCHIGPTGALRVPLNHFSREQLDTLRLEQERYQRENNEFEIYRATIETDPTASGLKEGREDLINPSGNGDTSQEGEAITEQDNGTTPIVAANSAQDLVYHGTGHRTMLGHDHQPQPKPGESDECRTVHGLRTENPDAGHTFRGGRVGGGVSPQLARGRGRERSTEPPGLNLRRTDRGRSPTTGRRTSTVSSSTTGEVVEDSEARSQLPTPLLGLPGVSRTPVRLLRVGELSTVVEACAQQGLDRQQCELKPEDDDRHATLQVDELSTHDTIPDGYGVGDTSIGAGDRPQLPTSEAHHKRIQQPCATGEVQGLRHADLGGEATAQEGQEQAREHREQHDAILDPRRTEDSSRARGRVRSLSTLEGIEAELEQRASQWNRQAERSYRQAVAAVGRATESLTEIMSLLKEDDLPEAGWDRIRTSQSDAQCTRSLKKVQPHPRSRTQGTSKSGRDL